MTGVDPLLALCAGEIDVMPGGCDGRDWSSPWLFFPCFLALLGGSMGGFPPASSPSTTLGDSLTGSGVGIEASCFVAGGVGRGSGGGVLLTELYGGGASGIMGPLLPLGRATFAVSQPSSLMVGEVGAWWEMLMCGPLGVGGHCCESAFEAAARNFIPTIVRSSGMQGVREGRNIRVTGH